MDDNTFNARLNDLVSEYLEASGDPGWCEHPEAQWRDKNGDVVETEDEAFGCKTRYELIHPDHFIFVDKVGNNTSQAKDGQVGGQTYLCSKDGRPQQQAANSTTPVAQEASAVSICFVLIF